MYIEDLIKQSGPPTPSNLNMSAGETQGFGQAVKLNKKQQEASKLQNEDLQGKTDQMQNEYAQLLEEMEKFKEGREHGADFYDTYNETYGKGKDDKKHSSPTKRLVKLKDTTVDHKKVMQSTGVKHGDQYSLTYCANPQKSYVVEPGREINYKLVEKDPEKFY
jgi:hypothetical protein